MHFLYFKLPHSQAFLAHFTDDNDGKFAHLWTAFTYIESKMPKSSPPYPNI